jgi:XXXCH domain-containing protein
VSSFKETKKQLKAAYKEAGVALDEGRLPGAGVAAIMRDKAAAMVDLARETGMAEPERYAAFARDMEAFLAAVEAGDPAAAQRAYDALKSRKSDCHHQLR